MNIDCNIVNTALELLNIIHTNVCGIEKINHKCENNSIKLIIEQENKIKTHIYIHINYIKAEIENDIYNSNKIEINKITDLIDENGFLNEALIVIFEMMNIDYLK